MNRANRKLLVIEVAGLSQPVELPGLAFGTCRSVFPAVTCVAQASFRTASPPSAHGMVANGRFFRELRRPMFWEQSARLVAGRRIWENFRARGGKVGMLFWQQSLGEDADVLLSPAPIHKHHGGMIQDCYSKPEGLYRALCERLKRPFKLRQYWGPLATPKVGEWIAGATAAVLADTETAPDLCLTYLPTLDYDLQRHDPSAGGKVVSRAVSAVQSQLGRLLKAAEAHAYQVLIFGDYAIRPVEEAVYPNRALREAGLMSVRAVGRMLYPDFHASRAFAMVDHEIAHVYVPDPADIQPVRRVLVELPGVAEVMDTAARKAAGIDHPNSGELVIVAAEGKWLAYPWWRGKREAPEFASHVDIHSKPGYDPCELRFGWPPMSVSQNPAKVRGSHGRVGPGREVAWAATFKLPGEPANLIDLAAAVRDWLDASS